MTSCKLYASKTFIFFSRLSDMQKKLSEEIAQNKQNHWKVKSSLSEVESSIKELASSIRHVQLQLSMRERLNEMREETVQMQESNGKIFATLDESKDKPYEIVCGFTF